MVVNHWSGIINNKNEGNKERYLFDGEDMYNMLMLRILDIINNTWMERFGLR